MKLAEPDGEVASHKARRPALPFCRSHRSSCRTAGRRNRGQASQTAHALSRQPSVPLARGLPELILVPMSRAFSQRPAECDLSAGFLSSLSASSGHLRAASAPLACLASLQRFSQRRALTFMTAALHSSGAHLSQLDPSVPRSRRMLSSPLQPDSCCVTLSLSCRDSVVVLPSPSLSPRGNSHRGASVAPSRPR
jgi:hypothetical protein